MAALGQQFAGALGLVAGRELAQLGLDPVDGGDRVALAVVDELGEDAAVGAVDGEARALGRADDPGADPAAAAQARLALGDDGHAGPLPDLAGDVLAAVADALALVGLRRAALADVRGDLADQLLVDPADDDLGRLRDLELDALGRLDRDRVRVAERHLQVLALELRPVADALDLELLLEAVGDALDHVRDQAAGEAVQGAVLAAVGRARDGDRAVRLLDLHVRREALVELALGALDRDPARGDLDRDGLGQLDGLSSDSAHRGLDHQM